MGNPVQLYDQDYYAWTQAQAASLRRVLERRGNLDSDLDLENLAEEIESMGRSDWRGLQSALERIIEHLLKLEFSSAQAPRIGWRVSIIKQRRRVEKAILDSPSLESRIDLADAFKGGRQDAAVSLENFDGIDPAVLPLHCPYRLEQLRQVDWYPTNRHGLS